VLLSSGNGLRDADRDNRKGYGSHRFARGKMNVFFKPKLKLRSFVYYNRNEDKLKSKNKIKVYYIFCPRFDTNGYK